MNKYVALVSKNNFKTYIIFLWTLFMLSKEILFIVHNS